jgi:hypothetical protein
MILAQSLKSVKRIAEIFESINSEVPYYYQQHDFPYAIAVTFIGEQIGHLYLMKITKHSICKYESGEPMLTLVILLGIYITAQPSRLMRLIIGGEFLWALSSHQQSKWYGRSGQRWGDLLPLVNNATISRLGGFT